MVLHAKAKAEADYRFYALYDKKADLPPEQYAYRPGRNAQQAVVEVGGLLHRGHPEVVDADLADYLDDASYYTPACAV